MEYKKYMKYKYKLKKKYQYSGNCTSEQKDVVYCIVGDVV